MKHRFGNEWWDLLSPFILSDKWLRLVKAINKDIPNLIAEAGLEGDWDYTGGIIYSNKKSTTDDYTYLASNWAIPTLILNEEEEIPCFIIKENTRFNAHSKWDRISLNILNTEEI